MVDHTQSNPPPTDQPSKSSSDPSTARFDLSAETFALAELFERVPDARVEYEPAVATPDDHALLVVRTTENKRRIDAALEAAPEVAMAECFGEHAKGWTYRVIWQGCPLQLIRQFVAEEITLQSIYGRDGWWHLRVVVLIREKIARAATIMDELGCNAECRQISTFDGKRSTSTELTDEQYEAIVAAFENGYYKIPRDVTAEDLADEMGISHQALSERLRRATEKLVGMVYM